MLFFLFILFMILVVAIVVLAIMLNNKTEQLQQMDEAVANLKKSFDELDEQAKIIVKTDLELNKAQEELDNRMKGLDALQKVSRLISTTLDQKEIYERLDKTLLSELGFEKSLIGAYDENGNFQLKVHLGFSEEDCTFIIKNLEKEVALIEELKNENIISSINATPEKVELISNLFQTGPFLLSPIITQAGMIGIVFVGNRSTSLSVTEGDEELISILANQIGQALENARLFEETYKTSQSLERKVQNRTKQLASALDDVKLISKTKSEFISAVSHELRTPLTSIKGYAAILISGKLGEVPDAVKQRLEKINTHSDNLVHLINDLLDISRIEFGGFDMNLKLSSIEKSTDNVYDLLTPQLKEKNINWECTIDDQVQDIMMDSSQIDRVFINLVGNAIKFTPENGTIRLKIFINDDNHLQVEISDTGIGITESDIKRLFDEFYRVENKINQNVKGSGLGLSLVKKIIEAHHGEIWVTSVVDNGTTFHFTLPTNPNQVEQS